MLDYRTLSLKPSIRLAGSDEPTPDFFSITYMGGARPRTAVEVTEEYVARPDLISLAVYSSDSYGDIICKYNGISNPFELNEGMTLLIPDLSDAMKMYPDAPVTSRLAADNDKLAGNARSKKRKGEKRHPNELVEGEENYVVDENRGIIFY